MEIFTYLLLIFPAPAFKNIIGFHYYFNLIITSFGLFAFFFK